MQKKHVEEKVTLLSITDGDSNNIRICEDRSLDDKKIKETNYYWNAPIEIVIDGKPTTLSSSGKKGTKDLYKNLNRDDNFSDRLTLFLLHFSFFLKNYKNEENKSLLQEIYDFNFRQLELSIREIGYGDQSINKKMKDYINLFHSMVSEIHFWEDLSKTDKIKKISSFLSDFDNIEYLLNYFENFNRDLSKKTLNSFLKSVSNL